MKLRIIETVLTETIEDVKKYYPKIPDDIFMELIALDPTFTGKDSVGKYGKWLLNLYNKGKLDKTEFSEVTPLLNQFTTYRNRIQNKDLNAYKTLDDLAEILAQVVDDDSMLTPSQKTKFLKRVKSGKIKVDKSDDYDVVLDTPNFIVYVPNTHEASMNLGKGTKWCTAHENPEWYDKYTQNGHKLYIIKDKKTGKRWQYSDKTGDFLNQKDKEFSVPRLMKQDKQLSKFFAKFLGVDYTDFKGTYVYNGNKIPEQLKQYITKVIIEDSVSDIGSYTFCDCESLKSIEIPNSVTIISDHAFKCCGFEHIIIPDSVKEIGYTAFLRCKNLKTIKLPNDITSIENGLFYECTNLEAVDIPNGVEQIKPAAFYKCKNLTHITLPNTVKYIGDNAFYECSNLQSIIVPNGIDWDGTNIFRYCPNLTVYTDDENFTYYCERFYIPVKPLSAKNESYRRPNKLKLMIKE